MHPTPPTTPPTPPLLPLTNPQGDRAGFLATVRSIHATVCPTPTAPLFRYGVNPECAAHNDMILQSFDYDLAAALKAQRTSTAGYGSEFRPVSHLEPLLRHHKHWSHLRTQLTKGASYPRSQLNEPRRKAFLLRALKKGNHKPARDDPDACANLSSSDVSLGYTLLLPASASTKLKRAEIYPISVMYQPKIQPDGSIKDKQRLTHDLGAPRTRATTGDPYPLSINDRTIMADLIPCIFGFALIRLLHAIHALRVRYPSTRILLSKTDLEKVVSCSISLPSRGSFHLSLTVLFHYRSFRNI